jgi:two-component system OmpR family response regulator
VTRGGVEIVLSRTEYELLRFLMVNHDHVLPRSTILTEVWGEDVDIGSTVVETYVSYLRRKLAPTGPPLIETLRGFGYVLRAPRQQLAPR